MKMKKRLLLIAIPVLVLLLGPRVIPVLRPWSAVNYRVIDNFEGDDDQGTLFIEDVWVYRSPPPVEPTTLSE